MFLQQRGRQVLQPAPNALCRGGFIYILYILIPLLCRIDINYADVTVMAFNNNNILLIQRRIQGVTSTLTTGNLDVSGTRKIRWGYNIPLQYQGPNFNMQLYLMNWFGFGKNNNDDENGGSRTNDSGNVPSSDLSSTMLLSSSSKEFTGKNSNGSSRTGGGSSSSGVVSIMDSMDQLKRSQRIGKITATLVQELKSITVEGSSENGKIKITFDGQQNPISTYIDESYFREQQQRNNNNNVDTNELAKAITIAMKDARMKSIEKMNEKMKNVYNELGFYNTSP